MKGFQKKNNRIFYFKALINPPPLIEKIIKRHVVIFMDRFSWLLVFWVEYWGKQGPKQKNSTQKANNHENLSINMRVEKFTWTGYSHWSSCQQDSSQSKWVLSDCWLPKVCLPHLVCGNILEFFPYRSVLVAAEAFGTRTILIPKKIKGADRNMYTFSF